MPEWTVRVVAEKAFMGNPDDPLVWHFLAWAPSATDAIAQIRVRPEVPADAEITASPGRMA